MKTIENNLNIQEIKQNLKYEHDIEIFDSIDSTNKYLKSKINEKKYGTIVISNEQTNGYGKKSRQFMSNKDIGIYMSILINPNCLIEESLKITILTSVAILSAIKSVCNLDVKLKWVNDIILNDLKVGGILCESQINLNTNIIDNMIVGIGINVKKFDSVIDVTEFVRKMEKKEKASHSASTDSYYAQSEAGTPEKILKSYN